MSVATQTLRPGYKISRVIRGGWQLAGGHGPVDAAEQIEDMIAFADAGITTFDCADIFSGVEELIGAFRSVYGNRRGAEALAQGYRDRLDRIAAIPRATRLRVWIEEWDEPLISGIGWVSELVGIAGGQDVFPDLAAQKAARDRILLPDAVIPRAPEVILASWCGKKVVASRISGLAGWQDVPAVAAGRIHEIKSPLILQPGPAALTDGLDAIVAALWPGDQSTAGA